MGLIDWSLPGHKLVKAVVMSGAVGAGALLFLLCAHLLRSGEAGEAVALFRRKVLKR
jgi:putative peptidoglycan lipid II flippase